MKNFLLLWIYFIFLYMPFSVYAQGVIGAEQNKAIISSLPGRWIANTGNTKLELSFNNDGSFLLDGKKGKYFIQNNILKLDVDNIEVSYKFDLTRDILTLSGGDLQQPLKFFRQREIALTLRSLFHFSSQSAKLKLYRIIIIIIIALFSRFIIIFMRWLSHLIIFSNWGPLKFLYTHHKNRSMTIHLLCLNLFKYLIYFTALGFVLAEFGVNYKAYLASLSVFGLAIGFGSQGLVQDMVTGFFLIFEGQFDVGDMVEISGQTGIVEEIGLRMTRLRNYLGQRVVIPNRNIAIVGNFTKGALEAYIDIAVSSLEVAKQESKVLQQISKQIHKQFDDIILKTPELLEPVSLATGEYFLRMRVLIWPGQQWVIEQQLIPRIREVFKSHNFEIPKERIIVFYHASEKHSLPTWRSRSLKKHQ